MFKRLIVVATIMMLFIGIQAERASAELITNGGFTTGDFTGWTISGNTDMQNGTAWYLVNSDGLSLTPAAPSAYYAQFGSTGSPTFISQNIATAAGTAYAVSFYLANDMPGTNEFKALWNGALQTPHLVNADAFDWTQYQFTATATGSSTPISFGFQHETSVFNFTNVTAAPVPIPGALLLFGPGLVGIAAIRKRLS